jgi:hypothetical protein
MRLRCHRLANPVLSSNSVGILGTWSSGIQSDRLSGYVFNDERVAECFAAALAATAPGREEQFRLNVIERAMVKLVEKLDGCANGMAHTLRPAQFAMR